MFNKEESENFVFCSTNENIPIIKEGLFMVTTSLQKDGEIISHDIMDWIGSEENWSCLDNYVLYNKNHFVYDEKIEDLYHEGSIQFDENIYGISNFYIAYGNNDNRKSLYLVCSKIGMKINILNHETINLKKIDYIKLVDTTLFIDLLDKGLLLLDIDDELLLHFNLDKAKEIQEMVNNWDGKIHNQVPELAIFGEVEVMEHE